MCFVVINYEVLCVLFFFLFESWWWIVGNMWECNYVWIRCWIVRIFNKYIFIFCWYCIGNMFFMWFDFRYFYFVIWSDFCFLYYCSVCGIFKCLDSFVFSLRNINLCFVVEKDFFVFCFEGMIYDIVYEGV